MSPGAPSNLSIEVSLSVKAPEIISGGAVPMVVTLRNTTPTGGAFVHSPQADCPFVFTVEPEKGAAFTLSLELYRQQTEPNPPPPREQEMAPLRAGTSLSYPVDLAEMMKTPLAPGRYKISAAYPLRAAVYRSAAVAIQVVAPRVRQLELAPNGNRRTLGSAMFHLDGTGAQVLYQRESRPGKPATGVYQSRRSLRQPTSLAVSTDGEGATEPRWIGWTEDGKVTFVHVWGEAVLHTTEPAPIGPTERLVSPGWTLEEDWVMFLAAGPTSMSLITIQGREKPKVRSFPIDGGPANPQAAKAAFIKSEPAGIRLLLVWANGNRLMCSIVNPAAEATPSRELARLPLPLVAVDIESVAREGQPIMHAVFADRGQAQLLRIRAGEENRTTAIPLPPDTAAAAMQWSVLAGPDPAVAAQAGDKQILVWTPRGNWRTLYRSEAQASQLQLVRMEQPWAVWVDSAKGVHYRSVE